MHYHVLEMQPLHPSAAWTCTPRFRFTMVPVSTCSAVPPPPLSSNRLCVTVPSHPQGNLPQETVPSPPPPPITRQRTRDTKQESEHEGM